MKKSHRLYWPWRHKMTPLPSAVALCDSNPSLYCPGWVIPQPPPALITDPLQVNWDNVDALKIQGVNWEELKSQMNTINWIDINIANGTQGVNWDTINYTDWPIAKSQGVNWSQFILQSNNGVNWESL